MKRQCGGQAASEIKLLNVIGRHYVYNVKTARWAEIDGRAWRGPGRFREAPEEIPGLAPVLESPPDTTKPGEDLAPKNLILQISHACNLRCRYCSADFGRYGGRFRSMSPQTAARAVDFLFEASGSPDLAITYFGGEPLLNLEAVLSSARHALGRAQREGKSVSLHLVTNGVELQPQTLMRLDEMGFSLTVSMDGPKGCHDRCRPFPDGKGSHGTIARRLEIAGQMPIGSRVTVRGTFTRESAAFFPNVRYLARRRFSNNIAYEPVFLPPADPLALRWRDLPDIREAYRELARFYVDRWRHGDPFCLWDFDDAIMQLVRAEPRRSRCGAGVATLAVTAEGDLYACHMSTGMAEARIGNLEGGLDEKLRKPWVERFSNGRAGCADCWLRALCGGGCSTHAILYNKRLDSPYRLECRLIEYRYRLAFWMLSEVPELRERVSARQAGAHSDRGHLLAPLWACG
jgi:uncharacterized protein